MENVNQPKLILASGSPRRKELIQRLGLPFEILSCNVDEEFLQTQYQGGPHGLAPYLAKFKLLAAIDIAGNKPNAVIIAADTTVVLGNSVLNKPHNPEEARAMLNDLRGKTHIVTTALCAARAGVPDEIYTTVEHTRVCMRNYTDAEITDYIATGDPFDKAGGYAFQHEDFHPVERIEGCAPGLIGLQLCQLQIALTQLGVSAPIPESLPKHAHCVWDARCNARISLEQ